MIVRSHHLVSAYLHLPTLMAWGHYIAGICAAIPVELFAGSAGSGVKLGQ